MKAVRINIMLLLGTLILWNIFLLSFIGEKVQEINCFSYSLACERLVEQEIQDQTVEVFWTAADQNMEQFCRLLTMYFGMNCKCEDPKRLEQEISYVEAHQPENFKKIYQKVYSIWKDVTVFPVGTIANMPEAEVVFENSWKQARTFGGERVHEGTDLMATVNTRGIYPIYSAADGIIENIGWLKLGGYRIGIRGTNGAYYYYAHMAEYSKDFSVGEEVEAGTFLGFMGDTGYSDIPGTTGNFAVHLHFGIYLTDEDGTEYAVNSYPVLRFLQNHGRIQ